MGEFTFTFTFTHTYMHIYIFTRSLKWSRKACESYEGLEGQYYLLELDEGCNRKPVEVIKEGVTWDNLGRFSIYYIYSYIYI